MGLFLFDMVKGRFGNLLCNSTLDRYGKHLFKFGFLIAFKIKISFISPILPPWVLYHSELSDYEVVGSYKSCIPFFKSEHIGWLSCFYPVYIRSSRYDRLFLKDKWRIPARIETFYISFFYEPFRGYLQSELVSLFAYQLISYLYIVRIGFHVAESA